MSWGVLFALGTAGASALLAAGSSADRGTASATGAITGATVAVALAPLPASVEGVSAPLGTAGDGGRAGAAAVAAAFSWALKSLMDTTGSTLDIKVVQPELAFDVGAF